jgi:hypothetical protein
MIQQRKTTIAEEWEGYREAVIPKNAGEVQIMETRRAFYAGALALSTLIAGFSDKESDAEADRLLDELVAFNEMVKDGKA